MEDNRGGMT